MMIRWVALVAFIVHPPVQASPKGAPEEHLAKIKNREVILDKVPSDEASRTRLELVLSRIADIKENGKIVSCDASHPPSRGGTKITAIFGWGSGGGFIINTGAKDGAKTGDVVYILQDNRRITAALRLDAVHPSASLASVIDGFGEHVPRIGNRVFIRKLAKEVQGRIRIHDFQRGLLVDVGSVNHGLRKKDLLEVNREGRVVGVIQITRSDRYHSYAKPLWKLKGEKFRLGDKVQLIRLK